MTDRARHVLRIAAHEARRRSAMEILPEHVLLAIAVEGKGVAALVLRKLDVTLEAIATKLPSGAEPARPGASLPLAPSAAVSIGLALRCAVDMRHNFVGSEHLLVGAAMMIELEIPDLLRQLGLTVEAIRRATCEILGPTVPCN